MKTLPMVQALKHLTFYAITLALGLGAGAVAAEGVLRWVAPPPDTKAVALPESGRQYGYPAHFAGYAGGIPFRTNSVGFRGREPVEKHSAGELVVVVVGDSYAFGYGVERGKSFPSLIEEQLAASGTPVKVLVLALPGYNTAQELAALQEFAPRMAPDLILLSYHVNDIQRHPAESGNSERASSPPFDVREYSVLARLLLPQLASVARTLHLPVKTTANAEVQEYTENGEAWQRNQSTLKELVAFSRSLPAKVGVVVVPYFVSLNENHPGLPAYEVIEAFFREQAVPVTGVFPYVKGLQAGDLWINMFDGHPNEKGHAYIAKAALDLIRENQLLQPIASQE